MTREPNPYAKDPTLTTIQAMVMAVPSVIAEDVLNGPDVVNAQHQKNADIHVSDVDREKWNKVADTHTPDAVYTHEEDEETFDLSAAAYALMISRVDSSMTSYNEVTFHFSKSAGPDVYGVPWGSDEPVYMFLINEQTGGINGISTNAILPTPGGTGTFKFATPITDLTIGCFCTDPANMQRTMKTIGLRVSVPSSPAFNGMILGNETQIYCNIVCTIKNEGYAHANDSGIHITASAKQALLDIAEKVGTGNGLAMGENSQTTMFSATAYGEDTTVSAGVGIGYSATAKDGIAIGVNAEASGYESLAIGGIAAYNVPPTKATGQGSVAIGYSTQATVRGAIVIGDSVTLADENVICIGGRNTTNGSTNEAHLCIDTRLYLLKAKSPLAERYEGGAAALGYIVRDSNGTVLECGTRKLSELLTNNTAFAPATLDLDSDPPTPFLPTGITEPWEEPERVEAPEEPQKEANTPVEQLKAKLAEFAKTIRS
jgi:hypothetical protein